MENPKLCIDCKHHQFGIRYFNTFIIETNLCIRNENTSLVNGKALEPYVFCENERYNNIKSDLTKCGYQGIYWEAK